MKKKKKDNPEKTKTTEVPEEITETTEETTETTEITEEITETTEITDIETKEDMTEKETEFENILFNQKKEIRKNFVITAEKYSSF